MIDMEEINNEIDKLEDCGCINQRICEKLAILYIIRNFGTDLDPVPAKKNNNDMMMSTIPTIK